MLGYDNESMNFTVVLSDVLGNPINYATILANISTIDGDFVGSYKGVTAKDGKVIFSFDLDYGRYIISTYYLGSNSYLGSYGVNYVNVESVGNTTKTVLIAGDSELSGSSNYYVVLIDENGTYTKARKLNLQLVIKVIMLLQILKVRHFWILFYLPDSMILRQLLAVTIPIKNHL